MPIIKELCLREMLQQRYRDKILSVFDEWLSLLRVQQPHMYMWIYMSANIPAKCNQLRELLSDLAPTVQFSIISEILPNVFRKLVIFSRYCVMISQNSVVPWADLYEICGTILSSILFPCIKVFDLSLCHIFAVNVALNCLRNVPKLTTLIIPLPFPLSLDAQPLTFENKIIYLKELKKLINPLCCTKLTLRNLSVYCTGLKCLDVHASTELDDNCVDYIILLQNLEFLNIAQCCISAKSYQKILKKLPKLKNISWNSPVEEVIADLPIEYSERILNADVRTLEIMKLIEKLRNIIELSIAVSYKNVNLSFLVELTHLKIFTVKYFHFVDSCMNIFFEQSGHNLKKLEMYRIENMNLSVILRHCSNLKSLSLSCCDFSHEIVVKNEEMTSHFLNLETLILYSIKDRGYFHSFVHFYRNLKVFHAEYTKTIDNQFVCVTLEFEGFRNLEECVVRNCPITITAAHPLINSCHNLNLLGDLGSWVYSSDIYITEIKNRIRRENLALNLLICNEKWHS